MNPIANPLTLILSGALLMAAPLYTLAQSSGPFDLRWSTIDGGGGGSSGGPFRLCGTVGQTDAGTMNGGPFTLCGGFWSLTTLQQPPGAPVLSIKLAPGSRALVSWPVSVTGFTLEYTTNLGSGVWTPELMPVVDTATEHTVTVLALGARFYRLKN